MIHYKSISMIGVGHLGSSVVRGLIQSGYPKDLITITNRNPEKSNQLVEDLGVLAVETNTQAAVSSDIVILAVKPQSMQSVCLEIAPEIYNKNPIIVSLAGVINIKQITQWFGNHDHSIIRIMTNTPCACCKGTSALFANPSTTLEQKQIVDDLFNRLGYSFWVGEESMIDTLTAPIGCAPAYIFLFLEALQHAAVSRGIPKEFAKQISIESLMGATELAKESGCSFAQLREGVTTPHGVTAHSLETVSFPDFFDLFKHIYAAAEERVEQIKQTV